MKKYCSQYEKYGRRSYLKLQKKIFKRRKERRQDKRQFIIDFKTGRCCELCGYSKCIEALEFHHKDPKKKLFKIANGWDRSFKVLREEIDKCRILCRNCHAELHYNLKKRKGNRK